MRRWPLILLMLLFIGISAACGTRKESQANAIPSELRSANVEESSGEWQFEEVFSTKRFQEPGQPWMVLDADNRTHLVYGGDHLYHAWLNGVEWQVETVDNSKAVGSSASLAFDNAQRLHIAYSGGKMQKFVLYYAYQGPSGWVKEIIDPAFCSGRGVSLQMSAQDTPVVAYFSSPSCTESSIDRQDLKVATRVNNEWVHSILSERGMYPSLAIDSKGQPHLSYMDADWGRLYYASRQGEEWISTLVREVGQYSGPTSLVIDHHDAPHIFYYNEAMFDEKEAGGLYEARQGQDGSWLTQLVQASETPGAITAGLDSNNHLYTAFSNQSGLYFHQFNGLWKDGDVPRTDSIAAYITFAVDSLDRVHLAFIDFPSRNLTYAIQTNTGWRQMIVDKGVDVDLGYGDLTFDSQGEPHVAFHDQAHNLRYAFRNSKGWHQEIIGKGVDYDLQRIDLVLDSHGNPYVLARNGDPEATGIQGPLIFAYKEKEHWVREGVPIDSRNFGGNSPLSISPEGFPTFLFVKNQSQLGWAYRIPAEWRMGGMPEIYGVPEQNPLLSFGGAVPLDQDNPALPSTIYYLHPLPGEATAPRIAYVVSDGKNLTYHPLPNEEYTQWTPLAMGYTGDGIPVAVFTTGKLQPEETRLEDFQIRYLTYTQKGWVVFWLPLDVNQVTYASMIDQKGTAHLLLRSYQEITRSIYLSGKGSQWRQMEIGNSEISSEDLIINSVAIRPNGQVCGLFVEDGTYDILIGCLGDL